MAASEFCRREGINKNVFHRARVALLGTGARRAVTPVAACEQPTPFIDLGALGAPRRLEVRLELGDGIVLSVARADVLSGGSYPRAPVRGPCDMRKSFDGLSALVRNALGRDPMDGSLYVYVNAKPRRCGIVF